MQIATEIGNVEIVNEPMYKFGSADNTRRYPNEVDLSNGVRFAAVHGVLLDDRPIAVFGEFRCTGVHAHSAVYYGGRVFLAVGGQVACFGLEPFELYWQLEVDQAACFGIHIQPKLQALVSHGELEVARFTDDGRILWAASGADVFSESFHLRLDYIEVVDFNGKVYHFNYATGATSANPSLQRTAPGGR